MAQGSRLVWWKSRRIAGRRTAWGIVSPAFKVAIQWNLSWTKVHRRHTNQLDVNVASGAPCIELSPFSRRTGAHGGLFRNNFFISIVLNAMVIFFFKCPLNKLFVQHSTNPSPAFHRSPGWKFNLSPCWVNKSHIKTCHKRGKHVQTLTHQPQPLGLACHYETVFCFWGYGPQSSKQMFPTCIRMISKFSFAAVYIGALCESHHARAAVLSEPVWCTFVSVSSHSTDLGGNVLVAPHSLPCGDQEASIVKY